MRTAHEGSERHQGHRTTRRFAAVDPHDLGDRCRIRGVRLGHAAPVWPAGACQAPAVLGHRRADRGRRAAADRRSGRERRRIAGRVAHVQLRRAAVLGLSGCGAAPGHVLPRRWPGSAQGAAPVRVQRRPDDPEHGRRWAGPVPHRAASGAQPSAGPVGRRPAHGAVRRRGLLRGELRPARRGHRAALPGSSPAKSPPGAAVPGAAQPGADRGCPAGRRRHGGRFRVAGAAVRVPAGRHLHERGHVGAARAPGSPRRAHRTVQPQAADPADQRRPGRRGAVRDEGRVPAAGPGPLQGGQRHPWAPGRRPPAADRGAPAHAQRAPRRPRGPSGRRRVRGAAARGEGGRRGPRGGDAPALGAI